MLIAQAQKIYLDNNDSVSILLDKLNSVISEKIVIVIPENSNLLVSTITVKAIARILSEKNKIFIFIIKDRKSIEIATLAGLTVVDNELQIDSDTWKLSEMRFLEIHLKDLQKKQELSKRKKLMYIEDNVINDVENGFNSYSDVDTHNEIDIVVNNKDNEDDLINLQQSDDISQDNVNRDKYTKYLEEQNLETNFEENEILNTKNETIQGTKIKDKLNKLYPENVILKDTIINDVVNVKSNTENTKQVYKNINVSDFNIDTELPIPNKIDNLTNIKASLPSIDIESESEFRINKKIHIGKISRNNGILISSGGDIKKSSEISGEIIHDTNLFMNTHKITVEDPIFKQKQIVESIQNNYIDDNSEIKTQNRIKGQVNRQIQDNSAVSLEEETISEKLGELFSLIKNKIKKKPKN